MESVYIETSVINMNVDMILEEVWRIKDKLSREMVADPMAYSAKMNKIVKEAEKAGRKIIGSAEELRRFKFENERLHSDESASVLKENPPKKS